MASIGRVLNILLMSMPMSPREVAQISEEKSIPVIFLNLFSKDRSMVADMAMAGTLSLIIGFKAPLRSFFLALNSR